MPSASRLGARGAAAGRPGASRAARPRPRSPAPPRSSPRSTRGRPRSGSAAAGRATGSRRARWRSPRSARRRGRASRARAARRRRDGRAGSSAPRRRRRDRASSPPPGSATARLTSISLGGRVQATRPHVLGVAGQLEGLLDLRLGDVGPACPAGDALLLGLEAVERLAHVSSARPRSGRRARARSAPRRRGNLLHDVREQVRGAAGTSAVEIRQKTPLPASRPSASRLTATDGPYGSPVTGQRSPKYYGYISISLSISDDTWR